MIVKDADLRYVAAHDAMLRLCGVVRKDDILGHRARAFFSPPVAEPYESLDRQVLTSGEPCLLRDHLRSAARLGRTLHAPPGARSGRGSAAFGEKPLPAAADTLIEANRRLEGGDVA